MRAHPDHQAGFTFAELALGLMLMVLGAVMLIEHLAINYRTTSDERDRVFAYSKAQAILAEIQGFVDRGAVDAAVDLDVLDDGIVNKAPLTIQTASGVLVAPDHPVSGNYQRDGAWVWSRRITVQPFQGLNNRNVRYVTVRIFKRDARGEELAMADLSSVINSAGEAFPTTQVFDVYLFAVENIPGWWVFMDAIVPFVESMITDLENRNPGLQFRTHWITKASFGRNASYRPYTNEDTDSYTASSEVYVYPGKMPAGNASTYYYVPDNFRARMNVDGVERNGYDSTLNPYPYALADYYNHAMRYPDELALWEARVAKVEEREAAIRTAKSLGLPVPAELNDMSKEPTLRLFLEDLNTNPDKYRNAMIINLHGELLPLPALRNYSDPAKDPENHPADPIRVVTHPEELRTKRDDGGVSDSLLLRMYAWRTDARGYSGTVDRMDDPMVVELVGMKLVDAMSPTRLSASCTLTNVPGGVQVPRGTGSSDYATAWQIPKHVDESPANGEMYYSAEYVPPTGGAEGFTRLYLYNTPLVAPPVTQSGLTYGLSNSEQAQLYWMPYIPSPVTLSGSVPSFTQDLTKSGANTPKNTARWSLRLNPNVFTNGSFIDNSGTGIVVSDDVQLQIRTRIGTVDTDWQHSGTLFPAPIQPDNLSVTYAWWADSADDVPFTERSQFLGDPRHLPYKDCFKGGDDYPDAYNWYHDSLQNTNNATTQFTSLTAGNLGNYSHGEVKADVPRFMEVLRRGLTRAACVYTTLTGWSYYYVGFGNEIGYDSANGYPNSIPCNLKPWGSNSNGYVNNITGSRCFVRQSGSTYWWGMPWLGELYPDALFASQWNTAAGSAIRGNLACGTGTNEFYRQACRTVYASGNRTAYGTYMHDNRQRTAGKGCTTLFNTGSSTASFCHTSSSGNGTLTTYGNQIANNYNMTMPTAAPISRPFSFAVGGAAEHFNKVPYTTRYTASAFRTYYTHSAGTGSALVKLVDPSATGAGYVVVNGIDNTVETGTTFIAKFAVLSLVHSYFEAGTTTNSLRTSMLPRVEINAPTDITELDAPDEIDVQYGVEWTRWDGLPYTQTGTYSEDESELEYVVMYSTDNGSNWFFVQDDTPATPGARPAAGYLVADAVTGDETYPWSVPAAQFPEGSYLLRVDCYRQGAQVHYSYHQTKIFIQR
ncbi:MAG: hypothetical protein JNN13_10985 [Planctomycetes bacterium]|nr:hypothetical protein [Planctomycetota bacterium]